MDVEMDVNQTWQAWTRGDPLELLVVIQIEGSETWVDTKKTLLVFCGKPT